MIYWVLLIVGIAVAIYAASIALLIIGETLFDEPMVGLIIGGMIAAAYFLKSYIWLGVTNGYSLFMESPLFWSFVLLVIIALLFTKPGLLIAALILSGVVYVIGWAALGTPLSIYAFFGWMLAILATTPIAGVPLIFVVIGGYFVGRWMAKL